MKPLPLLTWVQDFLSDKYVQQMTAEQVGAYWLLLCFQWDDRQCRLPYDPLQLAKLSRLGRRWSRPDMAIVRDRFSTSQSEPGYCFNNTLRQHRASQENYLNARSKAGRKGAEKRWSGDARAIAELSPSQCESIASDPLSDPNPIPISGKTRVARDPRSTDYQQGATELPPSEDALKRARACLVGLQHWKPDHALAMKWSDELLRSWAADIDLINRVDGRSWQRIDAVIAHLPRSWWAKNVFHRNLGHALREYFDRIEVEMVENHPDGHRDQTAEEVSESCGGGSLMTHEELEAMEVKSGRS